MNVLDPRRRYRFMKATMQLTEEEKKRVRSLNSYLDLIHAINEIKEERKRRKEVIH